MSRWRLEGSAIEPLSFIISGTFPIRAAKTSEFRMLGHTRDNRAYGIRTGRITGLLRAATKQATSVPPLPKIQGFVLGRTGSKASAKRFNATS
jgi:hypothetical protein